MWQRLRLECHRERVNWIEIWSEPRLGKHIGVVQFGRIPAPENDVEWRSQNEMVCVGWFGRVEKHRQVQVWQIGPISTQGGFKLTQTGVRQQISRWEIPAFVQIRSEGIAPRLRIAQPRRLDYHVQTKLQKEGVRPVMGTGAAVAERKGWESNTVVQLRQPREVPEDRWLLRILPDVAVDRTGVHLLGAEFKSTLQPRGWSRQLLPHWRSVLQN